MNNDRIDNNDNSIKHKKLIKRMNYNWVQNEDVWKNLKWGMNIDWKNEWIERKYFRLSLPVLNLFRN
jgi:hypothetical protein